MINRDNLSVRIDFENEFCAAISIAKKQWDHAELTLKRLQLQNPTLKIKESGWRFHNGGYYYKEILLNSFSALECLEFAIIDIPVR